MNRFSLAAACAVFAVAAAFSGNRPETWFHIIGGNATKAGLTADLEAISGAGIGGIQFFHGHGAKWDGVPEQIQCLSGKWDGLVRHVAGECARLGLSFRMQNCPGWSMSGGPWISVSNAMRKLKFVRKDFTCGAFDREIALPAEFADADSDWHDVAYLAFPAPDGDTGSDLVPDETYDSNGTRVFRFREPVTVRTLRLPSPSQLRHPFSYNPDTHVKFVAVTPDGPVTVCETDYPQGCWQDKVPFSLACSEASAKEWRLTLTADHAIDLRYAHLSSAARLDNWEGLSGEILRGFVKRPPPSRDGRFIVRAGSVREVKVGDRLGEGRWTVLRFGHVNAKLRNHPAPKEATGWECDKLDPRGAEASFAGYIGRLVDGPLSGGLLKGMIIDSWECQRQNWTWRMEEYFRDANGYGCRLMLPAVFGWIIGDEKSTGKFLLDWRRTIADLAENNYYRRLAELARSKGLDIGWETAFGDVVPGDILSYWKWCDVPMCEFWQPYTPDEGYVGHPNFKPVKPCVSSAHLYGKKRVAAEAFTSMKLSWDEKFQTLKEQAVRHYARGVTHLIFHTYTHNPHTDGRKPGTSFGSFIGTPFMRGQTWWKFMPGFTGWIARCGEFLERGHAVVDVLRYLGDDVGHKPDELEYFPEGHKCDYLNADVLMNRLSVKDGSFVLPDGMSYKRIWIPEGTYLAPATAKRLKELAAAGGTVVYGPADRSVAGLPPQVKTDSKGLLWYQRRDGDSDLYFLSADSDGFRGAVELHSRHGVKRFEVELAPAETAFVTVTRSGVSGVPRNIPSKATVLESGWRVRFPSGLGSPEEVSLDSLTSWKDIPGLSEEARAFSGTGVYLREFEIEGSVPAECVLDLGKVRDFAKVYVNGNEVSMLWSEPYRCDISRFLRKGGNELRVEVTSTWFNRLAYDFSRPEAERKTWTVWKLPFRTPPCLVPGAKLRESGLLGPVTLLSDVPLGTSPSGRAFAEVFPHGAVRPEGWLRRQLELQAAGLTGNAERLYDDIGKSDWLTGAGAGKEFAWERGPYYAKGLVALALTLDDAGLKSKARKWVDAVLSSQRANGDFGPKNRNWWANMIALWMLRDWHDATGDGRVIPFMERYFRFQRKEFEVCPMVGDSRWAVARTGDEIETVLWLFRRTGDPDWRRFAEELAAHSADWTTYYLEGGDPRGPDTNGYRSHIVNFMQGLKTPPLLWSLFRNDRDRVAHKAAFDPGNWTMRQCGRPDRMLNGSEPLSNLSASEGTELCAVAERILSTQVVISELGDMSAADDLEIIAYNTLPGMLSPDGKGLRYYSLLNQPTCTDGALLFANNGMFHERTGAICPGPHSGFGCCRSNFHMAWPKFVQAMWFAKDGGILAAAYGPSTLTARLPCGEVTVRMETEYPFTDKVTLRIVKGGGRFPLFARIPGWAKADDAGSFRRFERDWREGDSVELDFRPEIRTEFWERDAVCVKRGALLYVLRPECREKVIASYPVPYEKRSVGDLDGFPRKELYAVTPWNYALVLDGDRRLRTKSRGEGMDRVISVKAVRTGIGGWGTMQGAARARPVDPPFSPVSADLAEAVTIDLVPYPLSQIRITLFPWTRSPQKRK